MTFLGIDLGASALKVLAINEDGSPVARISAPVQTLSPSPDRAEQNPSAWISALATCLDHLFNESPVRAEQISALSITAGTHIAVLCDADMAPVRPAIMWSDQRAASVMPTLTDAKQLIEKESLHTPNPTWTLAHLVWLRENEPDALRATEKILPAKDWIRHCLTGNIATDLSDAVGTQLVCAETGQWSGALCGLAGIDASLLPEIRGSMTPAGEVSENAARKFNLAPGTPVYTGAIDTSVELLAAGCVAEGQSAIKLASAGVVSLSTADKKSLPPLSCYPHCETGWYLASGMNSCTTALDWLRREMLSDMSLQSFNDLAALAPPGARGVFFHPYLMGERAPHWNPGLTASLSGMGRETGREDVARAGFEGIALAIRDVKENMEMLAGHSFGQFSLLGGGAKSPLWSQIMADTLQTPIAVNPHSDAAHGAALLALSAHKGLPTGRSPVSGKADANTRLFEPDISLDGFYRNQHAEFNRLRQKYAG